MSILDHIPSDLKRTASTNGGEYHGSCPWCDGEDRFCVWPEEGETGRYWCRQCDRSGDTIQLLRDLRGMSYAEACEATGKSLSFEASKPKRSKQPSIVPCHAPPPQWQSRARAHAERCAEILWSREGEPVIDYLLGRGLEYRTIEAAKFGYNPSRLFEQPEQWGLTGKKIFLPRGITIPWILDDGQFWNLRIRRPLPKGSTEAKYICPRKAPVGLYNAHYVKPGVPVLLVEGEIDAWSAAQEADGLIVPVATGGTCGARRLKWSVRLALASVVLVAFDNEKAGEQAARYWLDTLDNAIRWRPYWSDVNQMLQDEAGVREWIEAGLTEAGVCTAHIDSLDAIKSQTETAVAM